MKIRRPWTWLATVGALGFVLLRVGGPAWARILPACSVRQLTGLYCPGCGGTRCTVRLLQGDLAGAFAMNPLLVILGGVVIGVLGFAVVREWKGYTKPFPLLP